MHIFGWWQMSASQCRWGLIFEIDYQKICSLSLTVRKKNVRWNLLLNSESCHVGMYSYCTDGEWFILSSAVLVIPRRNLILLTATFAVKLNSTKSSHHVTPTVLWCTSGFRESRTLVQPYRVFFILSQARVKLAVIESQARNKVILYLVFWFKERSIVICVYLSFLGD